MRPAIAQSCDLRGQKWSSIWKNNRWQPFYKIMEKKVVEILRVGVKMGRPDRRKRGDANDKNTRCIPEWNQDHPLEISRRMRARAVSSPNGSCSCSESPCRGRAGRAPWPEHKTDVCRERRFFPSKVVTFPQATRCPPPCGRRGRQWLFAMVLPGPTSAGGKPMPAAHRGSGLRRPSGA